MNELLSKLQEMLPEFEQVEIKVNFSSESFTLLGRQFIAATLKGGEKEHHTQYGIDLETEEYSIYEAGSFGHAVDKLNKDFEDLRNGTLELRA